jgi:DNA polymerase-3 subunit epsilon
MLREIILDTETTGINPALGHRIVEIGALELINHVPSGRNFHVYINPERDIPAEAEAVHGLSATFLSDKPVFAKIADDFLEFIGDAALVIHNASFDVGFLNAELSNLDKPRIAAERVVDTLMIARQKHPMAPNSLDALCKRYGVDNTKRTKHGALLDSELLADVYIELIGGRQTALSLAVSETSPRAGTRSYAAIAARRPRSLPPRLTQEELEAHDALVSQMGELAVWKAIPN